MTGFNTSSDPLGPNASFIPGTQGDPFQLDKSAPSLKDIPINKNDEHDLPDEQQKLKEGEVGVNFAKDTEASVDALEDLYLQLTNSSPSIPQHIGMLTNPNFPESYAYGGKDLHRSSSTMIAEEREVFVAQAKNNMLPPSAHTPLTNDILSPGVLISYRAV